MRKTPDVDLASTHIKIPVVCFFLQRDMQMWRGWGVAQKDYIGLAYMRCWLQFSAHVGTTEKTMETGRLLESLSIRTLTYSAG